MLRPKKKITRKEVPSNARRKESRGEVGELERAIWFLGKLNKKQKEAIIKEKIKRYNEQMSLLAIEFAKELTKGKLRREIIQKNRVLVLAKRAEKAITSVIFSAINRGLKQKGINLSPKKIEAFVFACMDIFYRELKGNYKGPIIKNAHPLISLELEYKLKEIEKRKEIKNSPLNAMIEIFSSPSYLKLAQAILILNPKIDNIAWFSDKQARTFYNLVKELEKKNPDVKRIAGILYRFYDIHRNRLMEELLSAKSKEERAHIIARTIVEKRISKLEAYNKNR